MPGRDGAAESRRAGRRRTAGRVPSLDIANVGAGGGSIAWIDRGGMLQVGPQSAGATRARVLRAGGREPATTDALVRSAGSGPSGSSGGGWRSDASTRAHAARWPVRSVTRSTSRPGMVDIGAAHINARPARLRAARPRPRGYALYAYGRHGSGGRRAWWPRDADSARRRAAASRALLRARAARRRPQAHLPADGVLPAPEDAPELVAASFERLEGGQGARGLRLRPNRYWRHGSRCATGPGLRAAGAGRSGTARARRLALLRVFP